MNFAKSAIIGVAVGDALGVPVEFSSREELSQNPIDTMIGYGTYSQPPGTWSDDTSLTLCIASSIAEHGYNLPDIAQRFVNWEEKNYWTPHGRVFDIGFTTASSIRKLKNILQLKDYGHLERLIDEGNINLNGNGSLMRTIPVYLIIKDLPLVKQYEITEKISSLTHSHSYSAIACFIYLRFIDQLLHNDDKFTAYALMQEEVSTFLDKNDFTITEIEEFSNILQDNIYDFPEDEINSCGYVVKSLEASIWAFMNSNSYVEAVLRAVNLGCDTDTTGAITGGLAGVFYGYEEIPNDWIDKLARIDEIIELCDILDKKYPVN